jgi:hypothetical protein
MATEALEPDAIAELGIKLISSDNHVNEPRDLFISRFPAHRRRYFLHLENVRHLRHPPGRGIVLAH